MLGRLSLTVKIAVAVSVLFFVIFTGGAVSLFYYFEGHYKDIIADQQFQLLSEMARDFDEKLDEAHRMLSMGIEEIPPHLVNNHSKLRNFFKEKLNNQPYFKHFFDNGVFLFSNRGEVIAGYPEYREQGTRNIADTECFQTTVRTKKPYISKPYISSMPPHEPVIMFTSPIFNKNKELVAILGGSVSLTKENIIGELARVKIGKTGYVYLFDTDRTIIIHPDKTRIIKQDVPLGVNKLFDRAIAGFEGTGETVTSRGLHTITSFKRLKNKNWILGANYPVKEAYNPIRWAQWYLGWFTGIGIAISVLIIIVLMKGFLNPLSLLTREIKEIGTDTALKKSVTAQPGGEIGELALSFNEMLEKLSEREESLKKTLRSLEEREARISAILNNTIEGIITINEDRIIESFNPSAERIFGYSASEVVGKNVNILMSEPYHSNHDEYVLNYFKTGKSKIIGVGRETVGRRKDGSIFPIELSVSEVRIGSRRIFTGLLRDITERKIAEENIRTANDLLLAISKGQSRFIVDADPRKMFDKFLTDILNITKSQYGFIGEVLYNEENVPYMKTFAITNIAWNKETQEFYENNAPNGMEFRNLKSLFGAVMTTGKPVISNDPYNDPRRGGLPPGHPPLNAFLGLPLYRGDVLVGVLGIANRDGGYDEQMVELLQPFSNTCANIIDAIRNNKRREEAEKALRDITAFQRAMLDSANYSIISTTRNGVITAFNRAAERWLGYSAQEMIGKNTPILIHDIDEVIERAKVLSEELGRKIEPGFEVFVAKAVSGEPDEQEWTYIRKDGSRFPVLLSITALFNDSGEITGFLGVGTDITERKRSEEELQKLSRAIEHSSAVVLITDTDGIIEYVNPKFTQITGYTKEEAIGRKTSILKSGEKSVEEYKTLWDTIKSGNEWLGIFHNKKKSGEFYWASASISPIKDSKGNITHFVGVQEDISRIKMAEEELQKAKDAAEAANKAKSDFLASMSHEIRTPMNAIIGMAELLLDTELNSDQRKYVQVFRNAGENLLNIINDILDISKIEAGHLELESTDFALEELIEKTCEVMSVKAHDKGIEFACHIQHDVPAYLVGDPVRLRQILTNLIGNAIKFTEKGEVVVEVKKYQTEQGNESIEFPEERVVLLFSVRDTGIGISEKHLENIFEKFTQADSSTTRKYGGTGLGLSISKRLIELMNGNIWVTSEVGRGSIFYFAVPFEIKKEYIVKAEEIDIDLKNTRVLIIDDNATNRMILSETLTGWGLSSSEADNGERGISELRAARKQGSQYNLLLLDYHMPVLDGFDVAQLIREDPELSDISIIMLTSDYARQHSARAKGLNIAAYITKPIKRAELKAAIYAALKKTKAVQIKEQLIEAMPVAERLSHISILIAEDSEDNRLLIKSYLKNTPYDILVVENGEEAVQRYKEGRYNIVLMDIQMPVMDGYTATRLIRKWEIQENLEKTPVIALTAFALKEEVKKSIEAGCDAHLTKPIKKMTLIEAIERYARK